MQLLLDTYRDGRFTGTTTVKSIRDALRWLTEQQNWRVRETLRTRFFHDSRFHVYLFDPDDPTDTMTLIFRY